MPKLVGQGVTQGIDITTAGVVLGRERGCDVVVRSGKVSRQHARVSLREGMPCIEDLGSSNGTRVNGDLIQGLAKLRVGDTVTVGEVTFEIVDELPPVATQRKPDHRLGAVAAITPAADPDRADVGKSHPVRQSAKPPAISPGDSQPQTARKATATRSRSKGAEDPGQGSHHAREVCFGLLVLILFCGFLLGRGARLMGAVQLPGERAAHENLKIKPIEPTLSKPPIEQKSPTDTQPAEVTAEPTAGEKAESKSKPASSKKPASPSGLDAVPDEPSGPMSLGDSAKSVKLLKELQRLGIDMSDQDACMKVATENLGMPPDQARRVMKFVTAMAERKAMVEGGVDAILKPKKKVSSKTKSSPRSATAAEPEAATTKESTAPLKSDSGDEPPTGNPLAVSQAVTSESLPSAEVATAPVRMLPLNRGPGYYINLWGLALVFGLLIGWRAGIQWVGQDIVTFRFENPAWLQAACVGGPVGSLLALFCPDLSWGIMLNSACMAGPLLAYVAFREERVPDDARMLRWPVRSSTPAAAERDLGELKEMEELGNLAGLGCHRKMQGELREIISQPEGLLLVCGPTGAGKSTTLRSLLSELEPALLNIITIENPIKYQMPGVTQVELNPKAGLNYVVALRKVMWKQPNVVMIEEIRDQATAAATCETASTGHLVLSTVLANDTLAAIDRLVEWGMEPGSLADTLSAVLSQRLIRRLCPECKVQYRPDAETIRRNRIPIDHEAVFCRPPSGESKCVACGGTGYRGRIGIFELLTIDNSIRALIRERAAPAQVRSAARRRGMTTLREDGLLLVMRGWTSLDEVHRATSE